MSNTDTIEKPSQKILSPATDIFETPEFLTLVVDLPGVKKDGIDIQLEKNVLTIKGDIDQYEPEDGYRQIYSEYDSGTYERSFEIAQEIDSENIEAKFKNGVLNITLPKKESEQPQARRIEIKTS